MSDIELAVQYSRKLESILKDRLDADGNGLTEKVNSVSDKLSPKIIKRIKWVAFIRNSVVHEDDFKIRDSIQFQASCEEIIEEMMLEIDNLKQKEVVRNNSKNIKSNLASVSDQSASCSCTFSWVLVLLLIIAMVIMVNMNQSIKKDLKNLQMQNLSTKRALSVATQDLRDQKAVESRIKKRNSELFSDVQKLNNEIKELKELRNNKPHSNQSNLQNSVSSIKVGSLSKLATKSKNEFESAKAEIDAYFTDLANNLELTLGKTEIRNTKNGKVDIIHRVSWIMNKSRLDKILSKYLVKGYDSKKEKIKKIGWYSLDKSPHNFAEDLYKYLTSRKLVIVLKAGEYSSILQISGGFDEEKEFRSRKHIRFNEYKIQYQSSSSTIVYSQSNPIEIGDIPESALSSIDSIEVSLEYR